MSTHFSGAYGNANKFTMDVCTYLRKNLKAKTVSMWVAFTQGVKNIVFKDTYGIFLKFKMRWGPFYVDRSTFKFVDNFICVNVFWKFYLFYYTFFTNVFIFNLGAYDFFFHIVSVQSSLGRKCCWCANKKLKWMFLCIFKSILYMTRYIQN